MYVSPGSAGGNILLSRKCAGPPGPCAPSAALPQFLKPSAAGSKIPKKICASPQIEGSAEAGEWNERCHDGQRLPPSSMLSHFLENVKGAFRSAFVEGELKEIRLDGPFYFSQKQRDFFGKLWYTIDVR